MKVLAVHFHREIPLKAPDGDSTHKWEINARSTHGWSWELDYDPAIRMLKVDCISNGPSPIRAHTWVPVENIASMTLVEVARESVPAKK